LVLLLWLQLSLLLLLLLLVQALLNLLEGSQQVLALLLRAEHNQSMYSAHIVLGKTLCKETRQVSFAAVPVHAQRRQRCQHMIPQHAI
jgi:hypothetical protein